MKTSVRLRPVTGRRVDPVQLVTTVCRVAGDRFYLANLRRYVTRAGIGAAVAKHDNAALYGALMEAFNYQGVSNEAAEVFLAAHGNVEYATIASTLSSAGEPCPKLQTFEAFERCGYKKLAQTCSNPTGFAACPLPKAVLRKGQLNQAAYSLYLFIRDRADGDLVRFIDGVLSDADRPGHPDRLQYMRTALVNEFRLVSGVSSKVINMTLATLLLGADRARSKWIETGASMIAVDTLVHNFLHRTGILHRQDAAHGYGSACYGPNGCEGILDRLARAIDARQFNPSFPSYFPRLIQSAIWRFCSEAHADVCNGLRIDDTARCKRNDCPLFDTCGRIPLHH